MSRLDKPTAGLTADQAREVERAYQRLRWGEDRNSLIAEGIGHAAIRIAEDRVKAEQNPWVMA